MSDGNGSNGTCRKLLLVDVPHWPWINTQEEKPDVIYWVKGSFQRSAMGQSKWDTDGNSTTAEKKNKCGHPRKSTDEDDIPLDGSHCCTHPYLEREDGMPISVSELQTLSQTACRIWVSLIDFQLALVTWGKILSLAWEYYARKMLNKPGLEFLWLCDDGQWKLQEWSQQSYSGWAKRHGIQQVVTTGANSRSARGPTDCAVLPVALTNAAANTAATSTPDSGMTRETSLIHTMLDNVGKDNSNSTMPLTTLESLADTHAAARQMGSVPTGTHRDTTVALASKTSPSVPASTHPRLKLKLGPPSNKADITSIGGNTSANPPPPNLGPTADPNPNAQEPNTKPTDAAPCNLQFEHAIAALGKKRKPEDKTGPSASSKKPKLSTATLATPSDTNSIKNICMQRWNELQPGGQGLADDFDLYFKMLTEANKELHQEESKGHLEVHRKYKDD
ncbi:hypothetical protein EI94DRAFT_1701843 [Lactarius quietus]|nr:hypothetical protein EI94DRAFT_1701843 [Lactarius quietus]